MKPKQVEDDIVIRIPRKLYNRRMRNILSQIEHLKIVSKSKATEKDITAFLAFAKRERGKMMKSFLKERGLVIK
ncbi:MAG: hypothetical protein SGI96_04600 [Bacteroidota bacterium]|nr:hypothetical protein [Bacteroidota bacterium]